MTKIKNDPGIVDNEIIKVLTNSMNLGNEEFALMVFSLLPPPRGSISTFQEIL